MAINIEKGLAVLIMVLPFEKLCTLPMRLKVFTPASEKSQKKERSLMRMHS